MSVACACIADDFECSMTLVFMQGEFDSGYLYEATFSTEEEKAKVPEDVLYEPSRHLPLLDSSDTPVSVMKYR